MSRSANRQQAIMEMMFKILADPSQATAAMNAFQKQTVNSIDKTNQLVGASGKKTSKQIQETTK
jgi:hypothetical protein